MLWLQSRQGIVKYFSLLEYEGLRSLKIRFWEFHNMKITKMYFYRFISDSCWQSIAFVIRFLNLKILFWKLHRMKIAKMYFYWFIFRFPKIFLWPWYSCIVSFFVGWFIQSANGSICWWRRYDSGRNTKFVFASSRAWKLQNGIFDDSFIFEFYFMLLRYFGRNSPGIFEFEVEICFLKVP